MLISFPCPKCGVKLEWSDGAVGLQAVCPHCRTPLIVPRPSVPNDVRGTGSPRAAALIIAGVLFTGALLFAVAFFALFLGWRMERERFTVVEPPTPTTAEPSRPIEYVVPPPSKPRRRPADIPPPPTPDQRKPASLPTLTYVDTLDAHDLELWQTGRFPLTKQFRVL